MLDVKQLVYDAVADSSLPLEDNPVLERKEYPYGLLRTIGVVKTRYKNYYKANWLIRIDTFSCYHGEKESLALFEELENKIWPALMENDDITYVNISHDLMDDKEQGPVTKHGIITIQAETMEV